MQFSTAEVVLVKVTGLTPELKAELVEFLRVHCIASATRANGGDDGYTGVLLPEKAAQVTAWLKEKGAELQA
jgi:hypothetical protein